MEVNGRQVGDIRQDHRERYFFARQMIKSSKHREAVLDAACGSAYGTLLLSDVADLVIGYDISPEALALARAAVTLSNRWEKVHLMQLDLSNSPVASAPWAVSFETIEHLQDPVPFLKELRYKTRSLIASVPNQMHLPYSPQRHKYHHRHYTSTEFVELLHSCGWGSVQLYHQTGKYSAVQADREGQTLIAVCE